MYCFVVGGCGRVLDVQLGGCRKKSGEITNVMTQQQVQPPFGGEDSHMLCFFFATFESPPLLAKSCSAGLQGCSGPQLLAARGHPHGSVLSMFRVGGAG